MRRSAAIHASGLCKRYGRDEALAGVDLSIPEGAVTLLVGPNGAGKTTLLKVFMDLLPFHEGKVRILGMDPAADGARIRAAVGFLPEKVTFPFDRLRVREILELSSRFRPTWDPAYATRLADAVELKLDRQWRKLSKGESRRVQLVAALAHRPPLLFLDEPTDGLDPVGRERVLGLIAEHLAETGATTLYCTHVLHEAQALADRLIVLKEGRVRLEEDAEVLRRTHHRVHFRPQGESPDPPVWVIRGERRASGEVVWVARAEEEEVRGWSDAHGLALDDVTRISLGDTALAYLAGTWSPSEGVHTTQQEIPTHG